MASCPSDLPARIKSAVPIPALLDRFGLTPNRQGFLHCPFHEGDRTPSFKVYPGGRGWYCFGCHRGGDVISLAVELYRTDYKGAIRRLNEDFHLGLGRDTRTEPQRRRDDLADWKRRREAEDRELEHQLDGEEWADCNDFIHRWPHFLDPWPWVWAICRLDYLTYRLQEYEKGGG